MKYLVTIATATALLSGTALAQDADTRGGAKSSMPSTMQNSPNTGISTGSPGTKETGPATINNAPVGSRVQTEDQLKQGPRTGDRDSAAPTAPTMGRSDGPATINNAPVGSRVQKEDEMKQAPRTGDNSKTAPTYR